MKPENIHAKITAALDGATSYTGREDIRNFFKPLLDELLAEATAATLSGSSKTAFQAALRFAKATEKAMNKKGRPQIAGAWTDEKTGKQYICDTFTLIEYDTPMAGLPQAEYFGQRPLKVEDIICPRMLKGTLPDSKTLRADQQAAKMVYGRLIGDYHFTALDGDGVTIYFDTLRLADAIDCMQSQTIEYDASPVTPVTIKGAYGLALVVPCRVSADGESELCYQVKHYNI